MSKPTKTLPQFVVKNQEPENVEAEEATLGSLLIDRDAFVRIQSINLAASDFYIERHGWIFDAMTHLFQRGKSVDLITLSDELARRGQLQELGGASYLTGLINVVPSSVWVESYAEMVKRYAVQRRLIAYAGDVWQLAYRGELTPDELFSEASQSLLDVINHNQVDEPEMANVLAHRQLERVEKLMQNELVITGIPTGLSDLDKMLDGLKPKKFYILAGQPGTGKSSLVLQIAKNVAESGKSVLIFSLEMDNDEITERLFCQMSGLCVKSMRQASNYTSVARTAQQVIDLPLAIDDKTSSVEAIRNRALAHQFKHGLDLVVVDYIQRCQVSAKNRDIKNRAQEVGYIGRQLKELSRELDIPVLGISSLNRSSVDRQPKMSDFKESGDLEYESDVAMLMWSPDVEYPNIVDIIIDKQRGGKRGAVSLYFQKDKFAFKSLETKRVRFEQVA